MKKNFLKLIRKYKNKIISKESEIYKNQKKILLTFDDGLTDHFAVAKELFKKKMTGIFFIPYLPYKNKKILNVHMSHLILGKVDGKVALNEMKKYINFKKFKNYINFKEKKNFHQDILIKKQILKQNNLKKS